MIALILQYVNTNTQSIILKGGKKKIFSTHL